MSIPELEGPAEQYYDEEQSKKYTQNSRICHVQTELAWRCIELLGVEKGGLVLDVGCGSGLSGAVLSDCGYPWVGIDISEDMLSLGVSLEAGGEGYARMDMGEGLHFQPGTFDGVISVSAVQWLLYSYSSGSNPTRRLRTFFTTLYTICKPEGRCVLQFYLKRQEQIEMLRNEAVRAGFDGGIQIDGEGTRNAKSFLVLTMKGRKRREEKKKRVGRIDLIVKKKERLRRKGIEVPRDSRYTGKRRSKR
ncbi:hypothetical protein HK407_01g01520 [Ordospora pajunii]|jgi:18S rRNA (guanine1575-N7)-methyltransferase|uniref:uncharacterized protein n=1 Tax=Ordospora pajunii TaxID=3039483 RepID=UPI0029526473|nr:uncharacterized protein HK407_01g01520 [Ordospora pajunii]KAH9412259.1 hypothetical protein HK407_01g01520 [Ordospora pajunii]